MQLGLRPQCPWPTDGRGKSYKGVDRKSYRRTQRLQADSEITGGLGDFESLEVCGDRCSTQDDSHDTRHKN